MSKEENVFAPKMRIQLLGNDGSLLSDRLISQSSELNNGPNADHKGPFRIEFTFMGKEDVESFQTYLGKLSGILPIGEKAKRAYKKKSLSSHLLDKEPIKELLEDTLAKCKTQDDMMSYLRELGFVFLSSQHILDFKIPIDIKPNHLKYQFMVRCLKEAKNPQADKFDPQLAFGFRLISKKKYPKVVIYLYGSFRKLKTIPWKETKGEINFKRPKLLVFPKWMNEGERLRFSTEHRKYQLKPELKKSKFYERWEKDVKTK